MGNEQGASILGIRSASLDEGALEALLTADGHEVRWCSLDEALRRLGQEPLPDLVIGYHDDETQEMERLFVHLREGRHQDRFVPCLVLCPKGKTRARVQALQAGADECMDREGEPSEMIARIGALLRIKSIQDRMAKSRRELQRRVATDRVTGLLNRANFEVRCSQELERARRYQEPLALLVVDLDGFREFNRQEGEGMGNSVLTETGQILEEVVREVDLVGRLSADTFGVVLPNTHVTGAVTAAERVWRAVGGRTFVHEARTARMTCSVGIAFFPARGVRVPEDLLRRGREALYRAKQEGRNRICLYQAAHYLYEPGEAQDESEVEPNHGGA
ncbi:MAG: diguanylate cyclase [Deltaproteobacteria bacterium]|nr:diguanylate cyclase [Deltaproteobacteria bacterium]